MHRFIAIIYASRMDRRHEIDNFKIYLYIVIFLFHKCNTKQKRSCGAAPLSRKCVVIYCNKKLITFMPYLEATIRLMSDMTIRLSSFSLLLFLDG